MSEINSIANGTFTIGQTSATNFVAGPGIKIDEPSAGTVRIGNDETVLWSGDASPINGTVTGAYSEPLTNFERVRITWKNNDVGSFKYAEYPVDQTLNYMGDINPFKQWWKGITVSTNTTAFIDISCYEITVGSTVTGTSANYYHLLKVEGINRISGGNE